MVPERRMTTVTAEAMPAMRFRHMERQSLMTSTFSTPNPAEPEVPPSFQLDCLEMAVFECQRCGARLQFCSRLPYVNAYPTNTQAVRQVRYAFCFGIIGPYAQRSSYHGVAAVHVDTWPDTL